MRRGSGGIGRVNLDWGRLRAVVLESDDWGLCAWVPDPQAQRVLADTPVFRSPAGRRYGGSTLESAEDVRALAATLSEFRGRDGFPPVWQANMVVAAPDYARLHPPGFECEALPLVDLPRTPSRWERPRMWLDVGEKEGQRTLHDAEMLARRLRANGWVQGQTLDFERVPDGTHDEASWARRVKPMLKFLFPR